ncbi:MULTISPECIES: glycosyltransferase family 4 protein [unclassified Streptomyces]|uniref:glycosyltransferase family 4 protein n=1 Tax=unclassified Streptomyces TaxID=2593676 RepID=UPI001F23C29B|nr:MULTISPECIES: glycosyltransferase family 4 protein [unclassified Streptomyces]MCF0090694.1 putative poly(glycerol-phosphate) alpha-glucosyltransferase [Streptomyces sp. MH192]MCF0103162.1 putative poly(glycerol-phosphate) alpha-glucosyltransferase [Streptomyces sp. MH191]
MHISFLLHNAYGIGGTIRTTYNLANTLAEQHDVEIVSVFRHREDPVFDHVPGVRVRHLVDLRPDTADAADPERLRPAEVFPHAEARFHQYNALTDRRIAEHLASVEADVVVGTRPGLNVHLARQTRRGPLRVGQEHLTLDTHSPQLRRTLRGVYPRLDALTTTTEADARSYERKMRLPGVRLQAVPNPVPAPAVEPSDGSGKWVVAAGRLAPVKRYDLLIRAFATVAAERPDWRLRIYGRGKQKDRLRALIEDLGLYNHVYLMGAAHPIDPEWAKGSLAAVTSTMESFGMTIVEAMRLGVPVVATDCPHGPGEIISDGTDGRLVKVGDVKAIAGGLLDLINNDEQRQQMSHAALKNSARFDPARIAERYESLFADLGARTGASAGGRMRGSLHRTRAALLGSAYAVRDAGHAALRKGRTS